MLSRECLFQLRSFLAEKAILGFPRKEARSDDNLVDLKAFQIGSALAHRLMESSVRRRAPPYSMLYFLNCPEAKVSVLSK